MRTIIAGSRGIFRYTEVVTAVKASGFKISCVISGGANGVDTLGEEYAYNNKLKCEVYPANWGKYGKVAGYRRNQLMAAKADALIAIWDGMSKGTKHMIDIATKQGLKVYVHNSLTHHEIPNNLTIEDSQL